MKLLIFSPYYPPHIGGIENYTAELAARLAKKDLHITIFTSQLPTNSPQKETVNSVEIIRFPAFEIISNYPLPKFWSLTFWNLFFDLFKKYFDVTISQTRFFSTSLLAFVFTKIKKKRWIHIEHGSSFVQTDNYLISFFARAYDITLGKIILNSSDQIIAISESVQKFVHSLAPKSPCRVIYRGFDIKKIEKIEPNYSLKEQYKNDTIIIFIGRLISGKGVADLLQAFSKIKKQNVKCFIIGDGSERSKLEKLAKELEIVSNIIFFGNRSWTETISILKIADIFVNPSYSEGLPTTVIESALCKKAIIATDAGGTKEIIGRFENGILIKLGHIKGLKEALELMLQDEEMKKRFRENAYDYVTRKFDWDKSIEKYIEIIT